MFTPDCSSRVWHLHAAAAVERAGGVPDRAGAGADRQLCTGAADTGRTGGGGRGGDADDAAGGGG